MPVGYDLRAFDVLDSTNGEAVRMAAAGAVGHTWVVAQRQTAGKGRRGREWVSPQGNLFASLLYALDCDLATASQLSFVTALAVRDVIADILRTNELVTCKWPNDILVGGKKISGILLETAPPSHVVIGIGINVIHHPEVALYPATNLTDESGLANEGGQDITTTIVFERLVHAMSHWISIWQDHGFFHIRKAWRKNAHGLRQEITVRLPHEEITGRFIDLDESGALILEFEGERRHITAGDVFFV